MLVTTLEPAKASSTAPQGIRLPTALNASARQMASRTQLSADSPQTEVHRAIEGRTCLSERAVWQNPLDSLSTTLPTGPRCVCIQFSPRTRKRGYRNRRAAPAEPANTTDRSGSRMAPAPPPAITAPTSASAASAQKAIAPAASSLQAATEVSAPRRRYLVNE